MNNDYPHTITVNKDHIRREDRKEGEDVCEISQIENWCMDNKFEFMLSTSQEFSIRESNLDGCEEYYIVFTEYHVSFKAEDNAVQFKLRWG